MGSDRALAWALFDEVVGSAARRDVNPWRGEPGHPDVIAWGKAGGRRPDFIPDYDTLERLLGVPVALHAPSQSGIPAMALDVWVSYELRRAGFHPDRVWPRPREPRVLPLEVLQFVQALPRAERERLLATIAEKGLGGAAAARVLGKNYVKQVDVVMSSWATGPELLVSTKRMDSSFGKNAANRVEESYGDVRNLRLRHPQAALGFVYALSAVALTSEPDKAAWLIDLLAKLGREDDAYDAVALILPEVVADPADSGAPTEAPSALDLVDGDDPAHPDTSTQPAADPGELPSGPADRDDPALFDVGDLRPEAPAQALPDVAVRDMLARLPKVRVLRDRVPDTLDAGRFFAVMCARILDNTPVDFHREARRSRANPLVPAGPAHPAGLAHRADRRGPGGTGSFGRAEGPGRTNSPSGPNADG